MTKRELTPDEIAKFWARLGCKPIAPAPATTKPWPTTAWRERTTPGGATPPRRRRKRRLVRKTIPAQVGVSIAALAAVDSMQPGPLQYACLFIIVAGVAVSIYDRVRYWREGRI